MVEQAKQIVVGYDGSEFSDRALDWAIREAGALSMEVKVVVSLGRPVAMGPSIYGVFLQSIEEEAEQVAATAVSRARAHGVTARGVVEHGDAAGVLVHESQTASVLVVGKRGRHGVRGRVGSVSAAVAAHARCPVMVLPDRWDPQTGTREGSFAGQVVVGVDKLGTDNPAIRVAAQYAENHAWGLALITVVPETVSVLPGSVGANRTVYEHLTGSAQALLDQVAQEIGAEHTGLRIDTSVLTGVPADQLLEATRSAELVAVGSRGYGGFRGLLMGSVSQAVLNDGESPVLIIPNHPNT
ncbi:universal stress protein [Kocuria sp. SM24M-10]|uniref:universal stress protein n=1 Tax=Kocuria sp. SM24M-10 TaxID=1660349 RepID=UPI00064ABF6A|nr:universal stress protein [Kocuria sp. SM24M-10]KLU11330.1 Universal stress family protein [Kocuria sp. SM24M-10]